MSAPDDGRVVDLLAIGADDPRWRATTIPDSAPDVRLIRLHVDRETRASLQLVEFPRGWSRPAPGHYLAGEEFVVLRGAIDLGGTRATAGDWVWVPPLGLRGPTHAPEGMLALAWFSAPAIWQQGAAATAGGSLSHRSRPAAGPLRAPATGVPGTSDAAAAPPSGADGADRDVLCVDGMRWAFVASGADVPALAGPAPIRRWR
ncbi:MAG: hypothetical protein EPN43_09720 [Jatrophihabitans sp.]|nr:MAG: hypothetical protein EPN43_09720 [Jatrophihabitans sp.]